MVDRIVPATTQDNVSEFSKNFSYEDSAPVFTETFSQWVIENNFAGPVPPWDKVGAQFVDDVAPFEALKLRTLNASHSLIAYLACLTGKETVAAALQNTGIRIAVEGLMREEAQPGLKLPDNFSIENYQQALLDRFDNTALNHRCAQIAMDGSQKIPQRLIPIIDSQLKHSGSIHYASLTIAAWLYFLRGETGNPVEDPIKQTLALLWRGNASHAVNSLLAMRDIFPKEIAENQRFINSVQSWVNIIAKGELQNTLERA
jgi:fructuronate reductase